MAEDATWATPCEAKRGDDACHLMSKHLGGHVAVEWCKDGELDYCIRIEWDDSDSARPAAPTGA